MNPLIDSQSLAAIRDKVSLFDVRWVLGQPGLGRERYQTAHIPGAVFVDLDADLSAEPGIRGRHPLPPPEEFAATLGRLGLRRDMPVVVYDDVSGVVAARLWWMLMAIGHERVQMLDGGLAAWISAGMDIEVGWVGPVPQEYPQPSGYRGVVTIADLQRGRPLIDARAANRFSGEVEPVDPKAGHIPGAVNVPAGLHLTEDGRFRSRHELLGLFSGLKDPIVSCGSGVTACHTALAMAVAGMPIPDVYVGSFSEWSRRALPVERSPHNL